MQQEWLGKRSNGLRWVSAQHVSEGELRDAASILCASRAVLEERMAGTLARVRNRVLRAPVYAANRSVWERIRGLDDLSNAPCTSSNLLPEATEQAPDWRQWVADSEPVLATAATSGSSGTSRLMPYTQRSIEHCAWTALPHLARCALEWGMPAKRTVLALTAPKGYVTYLAVPKCFAAAGHDVLHVPLESVLRDPRVALDLIDWLLVPAHEIHTICTVTTMPPLLISALEEQVGGTDALDRLRHSLHGLVLGGSELTPTLEALISTRLGLAPGSCVNAFAATELGFVACSRNDFNVFHASSHSHVLSIIALDEVEKAESDAAYDPKSVLLTRAPVGLVGELATTFDAAVPWINLRQGDVFEVAEPIAGSDVPRLRYLARLSSVQDVGGGRVWPASYKCAMNSLGSKVTDYLSMALKPGERSPETADSIVMKDKLLFYYEGSATIEEVADCLFDAIPMLRTTGPKLDLGTFDMTISNVRDGTLRRCRQRKSQEQGGSPGPLKHQVIRGLQYRIPGEDVLDSGLGWLPTPRASGVRKATAPSEPGSANPQIVNSSSGKRAKAG